MAGKYSAVISSLPRMLSTEAPYQERVEQVKAAISADPDFELHAATLAHEYAGLRAEKDKAEEVVSEINLRLEAVSQLLSDYYEIEGVSSLKTESGQSVAVQLEPYARVVDKDVNRRWGMTAEDTCVTCGDKVSDHVLHAEDKVVENEDGAYIIHVEKLLGQDGHEFVAGGGLERLMSLPWQTVNSLSKERLLDGQPPPPGVDVFAKTKIVLRKA
jgi:hypothetical protein